LLANSVPRGCNKQRKHAVRSWETRETNASEEPESAKWMVLQVAKLISKTVFGRFSADPASSHLLSIAYKLAEARRESRSDAQKVKA
jgi:hypothetical protein